MRISAKSVLGGGLALVVAAVMTVAGASSASAITSPIDPDPYSTVAAGMGNITFYNAAGAVVTSGDGSVVGDPLYAVADRDPAIIPTTKRGVLYAYLPVQGADPGIWSGQQLGSNTAYPIPGSPAPVSAATTPTALHNILSFQSFANNFPQVSTNPAYKDIYQIRLRLAGQNNLSYASATVTIDRVTGAWAQVFPIPAAPTAAVTTTTLAVTPATPENAPANVTLTATVAPGAAAGSVEFFEGTTSLGAAVPTNASGVATKALTGVTAGIKSYKAVFTPTTAASYQASTGTTSYTVGAPAVPTPSVALSASSVAPNTGDAVTFTANVTPGTAAGTIEFFSGTTSLGAPVTVSAGAATLTTSTLTGINSVTARFVSADAAAFNNATSPAVTVSVLTGACAQTGSACTDPQSFVVTVPVGSLIISTPFGPGNPFDLGTMALNADATELTTGAKSFAAQDTTTLVNGVVTGGKGITIQDGRTGNLPWTANLQSSNFVSGANLIEAKNLGFTGVTPTYIPGNALQAPDVSVFQNPAYSVATPTNPGLAASVKFASAVNGAGSVYVNGDFTLNAPTSTPAGIYAGTVTFTIS